MRSRIGVLMYGHEITKYTLNIYSISNRYILYLPYIFHAYLLFTNKGCPMLAGGVNLAAKSND